MCDVKVVARPREIIGTECVDTVEMRVSPKGNIREDGFIRDKEINVCVFLCV